MVGVALIFAAAASPVTRDRYLPLLMQSGTVPAAPASRAISINLALSGNVLPVSLGWMFELYSAVWGGELRAGDRSVDVYVSKLRSKLDAAMPDQRYIHTHPGFGYRFQPQPSRNLDNQAAGRIQTASGERL